MMPADDLELLPSRRIEIPTRFIQQAYEHARATNERYVSLLFVGEGSDLICVGVSTRRMLGGPQPIPEIGPQTVSWTLQTLTKEVIFSIVKEHAPIDTQRIGDHLGIPGNEISLRQRIRRELGKLVNAKLLQKTGPDHAPQYLPKSHMALHPQTPRTIHRTDITLEKVLEQLKAANRPISSKMIGDMMGIPRNDNVVRSKVSEHVRSLISTGQLQSFGKAPGAKTYQLIQPPEDVTQGTTG